MSNSNTTKVTIESKINLDYAKQLKSSKASFGSAEGQFKSFLKWIKRAKPLSDNPSIGTIRQVYTTDDNEFGGRFNTGFCYTQMYTPIRGLLAQGIYHDYDIQNCHPHLLSQYLSKRKIKCPQLDLYCANVQGLRKKWKPTKTQVLRLLNGGGLESDAPQFFHKLKSELDPIMKKLISEQKKWQKDLVSCKTSKKRHDRYRHYCSAIVQSLERQALMAMYQWCTQNHVEVGALIHDGCLLGDMSASKIPEMEQFIEQETGYKVKIVEKPLHSLDPEELVKNQSVIGQSINDDTDGAQIFLDYYNKQFVRSGDSFYILNNKGIWEEGVSPLIRMIAHLDLRVNDYSFSRNASGAKRIAEMIKAFAEDQGSTWLTNINHQSRGLVFFGDQVWNMAERKWQPRSNTTSLVGINRPAPVKLFEQYENQGWDHPHLVELQERILNVFGNDEQRDYTLRLFARAISGCVSDKFFGLCTGARNSGKGTLQEAIKKAFAEYVTQYNPPITKDFNSTDQAMDLRFVLTANMHKARIAFTNESRDSKKTAVLSGNIIKNVIASGGDSFQCRKMRENEVTVSNNCISFMNFNQIPSSNPPDAMDTGRIVLFPFKFDSSLKPTKTIKAGDPNIKQWINQTPWLGDAMAWAIFEQYQESSGADLEPPKEFKLEMNDLTADQMGDPYVVFTKCFKQVENEQELVDTVKEKFSKCGMSANKLTRWLKNQGISKKRARVEGNLTYVYVGLMVIEEESNGGVDDPQDDIVQPSERIKIQINMNKECQV